MSELEDGNAVITAARAVEAIARQNARDVDRIGRFPSEAIEVARRHRLLSYLLRCDEIGPAELRTILRATRIISGGCASTAMIFAMHQAQVLVLRQHAGSPLWQRISSIREQDLLLASATSERGTGGDISVSVCFAEQHETHVRVEKDCPIVSYGEYADAILLTARASQEAAPNQQVLIFCDTKRALLRRTTEWDTLGMRGTCSHGYQVRATVPPEAVYPHPYSQIAAETEVAASHLMWSGVWLGIATESVATAVAYLRSNGRDLSPRYATKKDLMLSAAKRRLNDMETVIDGAIIKYCEQGGQLGRRTVEFNHLKLSASEYVCEIVDQCLQIIGLAAYYSDGKYSLARLIRDARSAPIMISNDRLEVNNSLIARSRLGLG
ncbi:MAG: acyl-CoA/acyl-ACP dehydrogenase [Mycolicibacterium rufum]|nr:acyl-CoA/acyl-ACP dehydrogenase [Mycolicibacterium rufum]